MRRRRDAASGHLEIPGLNDSKKLTEKKRDELYEIITGRAVSWSAAFATVEEIEEYNILNATFMAMNRAIAKLDPAPELALIDGNRNSGIEVPSRTIIRGDGLLRQHSRRVHNRKSHP
jgi:ribonuclease HII